MAIYVICNVLRPVKMETALKNSLSKDDYKRLAPHPEWLVSSPLASPEIAKHIGITDGEAGAALVFRTTTFDGKALPGVLDWLESHSAPTRSDAEPSAG